MVSSKFYIVSSTRFKSRIRHKMRQFGCISVAVKCLGGFLFACQHLKVGDLSATFVTLTTPALSCETERSGQLQPSATVRNSRKTCSSFLEPFWTSFCANGTSLVGDTASFYATSWALSTQSYSWDLRTSSANRHRRQFHVTVGNSSKWKLFLHSVSTATGPCLKCSRTSTSTPCMGASPLAPENTRHQTRMNRG